MRSALALARKALASATAFALLAASCPSDALAGALVRAPSRSLAARPGAPARVAPLFSLPLRARSVALAPSWALPRAPGVPSAPAALAASAAAGAASAAGAAVLPRGPVSGRLFDPASRLSVADVGRMGALDAKEAGASGMDRLLGAKAIRSGAFAVPAGAGAIPAAAGAVPAAAGAASAVAGAISARALRRAESLSRGEGVSPGAPPPAAVRSPRGKAVRFLIWASRTALAAGAAIGLHRAGLSLLPDLLAASPIATVWAATAGIVLLPAGLYARYRLGLSDSPRLKGVKLAADVFLGVFLGGAAVAAGVFSQGALLAAAWWALPALGLLSYAGAASLRDGGSPLGGLLRLEAAYAAPLLLPAILGAWPAAISPAGLLALAAMPALTTIAFFLRRIKACAETGRAFSPPGSLQAVRFPNTTWLMAGVAFAILTGYAPVHINLAFLLWVFFGNGRLVSWLGPERAAAGGILGAARRNLFNLAYVAALALSLATGFSSPWTFWVLAFAPERAAIWTELLLARLLKAGPPAPSTRPAPERPRKFSEKPAWPRFHYWARTASYLGGLAGLGFLMGWGLFGFSALAINLGISAALVLLPVIFSRQLIKLLMRASPTDKARDPEIFALVEELLELSNRGRRSPNPMPALVRVPLGVPNAFATGPSPKAAMIGVTDEIMEMTLEPEELRAGLLRFLGRLDMGVRHDQDAFAVLSMAVAGSVRGAAGSRDVKALAEAIQAAGPEELRALGRRALRGVLAHEMNHVLNRDMWLGAAAGGLSSAIALAARGVFWAGERLRAALPKLGKTPKESLESEGGSRPESADGPLKPEAAPAAVPVLLGLFKFWAALFGPVLAAMMQMASSRAREGAADEDGAKLGRDPEALALGLALLTAWKPRRVYGEMEALSAAPLSGQMTVNPLGQMRGEEAPAGASSGRKDDFLFERFVTHPDTMERISRLYRMALASRAGRTGP